jgi:hypothetical protein
MSIRCTRVYESIRRNATVSAKDGVFEKNEEKLKTRVGNLRWAGKRHLEDFAPTCIHSHF